MMTSNETDPAGGGPKMPAWLDRLAQTHMPAARRDAERLSASELGARRNDVDDSRAAMPNHAAGKGQWGLPGFGPMLRIVTSFGPVPAQALRVRDLVRTRTGEFRKIEWVDRMVLDEGFMRTVPTAQPVLIRAGALGRVLPASDIVVSPEQMVCIAAPGNPPRYVPARELLTRPGVMRKPEQIFTYTRFHCGEPVEVQAEGVWLRANPPAMA